MSGADLAVRSTAEHQRLARTTVAIAVLVPIPHLSDRDCNLTTEGS
jgi:hypothetical protein